MTTVDGGHLGENVQRRSQATVGGMRVMRDQGPEACSSLIGRQGLGAGHGARVEPGGTF